MYTCITLQCFMVVDTSFKVCNWPMTQSWAKVRLAMALVLKMVWQGHTKHSKTLQVSKGLKTRSIFVCGWSRAVQLAFALEN